MQSANLIEILKEKSQLQKKFQENEKQFSIQLQKLRNQNEQLKVQLGEYQ